MTEYTVNAATVNWAGLERDVVSALIALRLAWEASEEQLPAELHAKAVTDLYVPALRLLGEFCACVETEEEHDA